MASKLAGLFKEVTNIEAPGFTVRVLTDYVASFNTVVIETEVQDLSQFEKLMADYMSNKDLREKMKGYTDMWTDGRREVYKVV
jgi:hypothetical protein